MTDRAVWRITTASIALAIALAGPAYAQSIDTGAIFRVFLKNGQALPSYGESALVGDRVVFTLLVGSAEAKPSMQLMSLPLDRVDLVRTKRYADALRAKHYADTRGEVDYAAMTQEVQRTLAQLTAIEDPKKRLELAEEAKKRLQSWASGTYGYRAKEIRDLTALFDEVIAELRAASGQRQFAVDLRAGPDDAPAEMILAAPTQTESVALALEAARAADSESDRLAILRAAESLAPTVSPDVGAAVKRELVSEAEVTASYTRLFDSVRSQAETARRRTDIAGVEAAIASLQSGDQGLGGRRRQSVDALLAELSKILEATKAHRAALDRYALMRGSLLQYERNARPVMSGFDGMTPIFNALRDVRYTAYERLERATARLAAFRTSFDAIAPPEDLADVHASIDNALKMAAYAVSRRRLAMSLRSETIDREAATAASGALMLYGLAREQLISRLYPPKIK
jgi:hypothetical protein